MAKPDAIRVGYLVALALIPETAPRNCYIGLVKAADEYGIRINPAYWDNDLDDIRGSTADIFIPWININSMLVCTDEEPAKQFVRNKAKKWQAEVESMHKKD